ncbi:MAG: hypothetical protein ACXIT9_07275 [Nitritalea sp.]
MKKAILACLAFLISFATNAQESFWNTVRDRSDYDRGFSVSLILPSFMTSTPSNLNQLLVASGYPHILRGSLNFGLGVHYRMKRFETGINALIGSQSVSIDALNAQINRTPLTANIFLQYHLFRKGSFTFYPLVGLSLTDTRLILSKEIASDDIGNLLQNPGTSMNLQHFSEGILVGFGVDLSEHWVESTGMFRVKFAYRIPTGKYPWESFFTDLQNAPKDSFPYFFVQLEIGFPHNWNKGSL